MQKSDHGWRRRGPGYCRTPVRSSGGGMFRSHPGPAFQHTAEWHPVAHCLPDQGSVCRFVMHDLHDKVHASAVGKMFSKASHMAHGVLVSPIALILKGVAFMNGNKWLKENYKEAANLIFAVIMIGYAGYGIMHSLEGISSVKTAMSSVGTDMEKLTHLTVDATKGADMTIEVLKAVIAKIIKA